MARAQRLGEPALSVVVLLQRRQRAPTPTRGTQILLDVSLQDRVRPDFEKHVRVLRRQGLGREIEANRLAHVVPPVFRTELLAVQDGARDGRDIGQAGGRRLQIRKQIRQRRANRIHEAAVECVFEVQDAEEDPAGREL